MAGFSTRCGGVSDSPYHSLNMAYHTGDRPSNVWENRKRFLSIWGLSPEQIIAGKQVHGTGVHFVDSSDLGRGSRQETAISDCDALISKSRDIVLAAFSADCLLVYLADTSCGGIAVIHAGWKGLLKGIIGEVIEIFIRELGGKPENTLAAISPGICFNCFVVGEDVAVAFRNKGWSELLSLQNEYPYPRYLLNLDEICRFQLKYAGLLQINIQGSSYCTRCYPDYFYSHRRDGEKTGRMMGFISLTG